MKINKKMSSFITILALALVYVVLKIYVNHTPDTSDDDVPDKFLQTCSGYILAVNQD